MGYNEGHPCSGRWSGVFDTRPPAAAGLTWVIVDLMWLIDGNFQQVAIIAYMYLY